MPQTVLGLDIGSYSIKAALFETTFRQFSLTDLFESAPLQLDDLEPQDRAAVITEAILRLLSENRLKPSTVVTALPGSAVSTRNLTLPLSESQLAKVLPFELESFLPFDLEEVLIDQHTVTTSKTSTTCLAAAAKKTLVAEHLALLRGAGLEPAFVGLDSLSLYNLNQLTLREDAGTYAIVDIGHQKTSVCIVSGRKAQQVRTLFTAGHAVTQAIRGDLDLTLPQAVEAKHAHGIIELEHHPLKSDDLKRLSGSIRKAVEPLVNEILQTFHAFRAQHAASDPETGRVERIYLCGGSSLIRNLPEYMTVLTGIPAERVKLFADGPEQTDRAAKEPALAQAVALGLRAAARGAAAKQVAAINFRKNEFSFARDLSGLKEKASFFGKWTLAVFTAALLHVGFKYENLARQKAKIDKLVLQEFKRIAPDVKTPPKNAEAALKIMKERIQKYRAKQEVLTAGLNDMTALGILREISLRIPQDVPVDTQELSIDRNHVTLRGSTDSFASVDRMIAALKEHPEFQRIDKGDIREAANGKKAFQLTITIGDKDAPARSSGRKGGRS